MNSKLFHIFECSENEFNSATPPMISSVEKLNGVLEGLAGLRLLLLEQLVRRDGFVTLPFGQSFVSKFLLKEIKDDIWTNLV